MADILTAGVGSQTELIRLMCVLVGHVTIHQLDQIVMKSHLAVEVSDIVCLKLTISNTVFDQLPPYTTRSPKRNLKKQTNIVLVQFAF